MAEKKDSVRMFVTIDRKTADTIEELAKLLDVTPSAVASKLLRHAVEDDAWMIRHFVAPLRNGIDRLWPAARKRGPASA